MQLELEVEIQGAQSVREDHLRLIDILARGYGFPGIRVLIEAELRNRMPGAKRQPLLVNASFLVQPGGQNELAIALDSIARTISFFKVFQARAASSGKPGELEACRTATRFLEKFYEALDLTTEMEYLSVIAAVEPEVGKVFRPWPEISELIMPARVL